MAWDSGNLDLSLACLPPGLCMGPLLSHSHCLHTNEPDHMPLHPQGHFTAFPAQRLMILRRVGR